MKSVVVVEKLEENERVNPLKSPTGVCGEKSKKDLERTCAPEGLENVDNNNLGCLRENQRDHFAPQNSNGGKWHNGEITFAKYIRELDGSVLEGEMKFDSRERTPKLHGKGKLTHKCGAWFNGMAHGNGVIKGPKGELVYKGEFFLDKKNGFGQSIGKDGCTYNGEWSNGSMHGKGIIQFLNGDKYIGQWKNNQQHGNGKLVDKDGCVRYKGQWENGEKHGEGRVIHPNGSRYKGMWKNGEGFGKGKLITEKGVYEGDFVNSLRHGNGTFRYHNRDVYIGSWSNGLIHGQGTYYSASKDTYEGEFFCGVRHGLGIQYFRDGSSCAGRWYKDKIHGKGMTHSGREADMPIWRDFGGRKGSYETNGALLDLYKKYYKGILLRFFDTEI